jgi:REP element-mobilizing transposase RayT
MTQARSSIVHDDIEGVYHCISRCVRRAFLCGRDPVLDRDYEHRKEWIYQRLIQLADIFLIDVCGYAIMSNHAHIVLRNRPDLTAACSDEEIARRWWRLFPKRRTPDHFPAEPSEEELVSILADERRVAELRKRLTSISWFMRCLNENIARRANAEDRCTGRFWEGRFKCVALLDQAAILTCTAYVDLNPIRAGIALTPETSEYTSVKERISAHQARYKQKATQAASKGEPSTDILANLKGQMKGDQWLCPLKSDDTRRGFLDMDLEDYLALVDWTGRQIAAGKAGAIPGHLAPILERLEINRDEWLRSTQHFGSLFYRVAGTVSNMAKTAVFAGQKWLKGKQAGALAFLQS